MFSGHCQPPATALNNTTDEIKMGTPQQAQAQPNIPGNDAVAILEAQTASYDEVLDLLGFDGLPAFAAPPAPIETPSAAAPENTAPSVSAQAEPEHPSSATETPAISPEAMVFIRAADAAVKNAAVRQEAAPQDAKAAAAPVSGNNSLAQMMMRRRDAGVQTAVPLKHTIPLTATGTAAPRAASPEAEVAVSTATETVADPLYGLPLADCIEGHQEWSRQLTDVLRGRSDGKDVGDTHHCPLGRWLDGEGRALSRYREFTLLRQAHDRFHECAAKIVEQHQKGALVEAIRMLRSDLPKLAEAIGEQAFALQKAVHG